MVARGDGGTFGARRRPCGLPRGRGLGFLPQPRGWLVVLGVSLCQTLLLPPHVAAQDAAGFFKQICVSCHTIGGGRLVGPDLKDLTQRRDRAWLLKFLADPKAMIDSGDPYAAQLLQDARGVVMPPFPGMTPAMNEALISLIEAESKLEKSQFAGLHISDRPFTAQDIQLGRRLVRGEVALSGGGPPCLACHTLNGVGALGGGKLGPDLSKVYERLQGRKPLSTWLSAPATPTMQSVFKQTPFTAEEILPLVAYFEDTARQGGQDESAGSVTFLLFGLGGAALGLVLFDGVWSKRFRAVRRPLVESVGPKR